MSNRKSNILKIFLVILCLCGVALFALIESGVNIPFIQTYKNNFKKNVNGICQMLNIEIPMEMQLYLDDMSTPTPKPTMTPVDEQQDLNDALGYPEPEQESIIPQEGTVALTTKQPTKIQQKQDELPIAFDAASNAKFEIYKNYIICANETTYMAYDMNGKLMWQEKLQMQNPILSVKGEYILLAETGAKKINLYKGKKLLFSTKTAGNIITASVSKKGDVVAVTEKQSFKGQVVVYNNSGKKIFAWDSGSYDILDASISANRQVAVSFLNTDEGADSSITTFSVDGKVNYKTDKFKDTIVFALDFNGEILNAFSESRCLGISSRGKTMWEYKFDDKKITKYSIAQNGYKMLLFDNDNTGEIVALSAGGKVFTPIKAESMPDCMNIKSNYLAYNSGRDIFMTKYNGKNVLKATCDSDIKQIYIIDSSHVLCVYNSSIQVKKLEKTQKQDTVIVSQESTPPSDKTDKKTENPTKKGQ